VLKKIYLRGISYHKIKKQTITPVLTPLFDIMIAFSFQIVFYLKNIKLLFFVFFNNFNVLI
jgi:hypothetical protein